MVTTIKIEDFKSISRQTLALKNLNLFSGTNSSGKSSSIQTLLLAADNLGKEEGSHSLLSFHVPISSFNETRNYMTNAKSYTVELTCNDRSVRFSFLPKDDSSIGTVVEQSGTLSDTDYDNVKNIFHLSAMRSGDLGSPKINPAPDMNPLGTNGEYIIDYYYTHRHDLLPENLIAYNASRTLEGQVNYWLRKLTGYTISIQSLGAEYIVKFMSVEGKNIHPYNVGTGVNFIAETLMVCLSTRAGGIVIVENPEIHLHPSAQAQMLDFLVHIAKAGIQVVIESHSDHIFNGIRRTLSQGGITLEEVSVYNFTKENGLTKTEEVKLSPQGGIENYIPGMFDQFDLDLDAILMQ